MADVINPEKSDGGARGTPPPPPGPLRRPAWTQNPAAPPPPYPQPAPPAMRGGRSPGTPRGECGGHACPCGCGRPRVSVGRGGTPPSQGSSLGTRWDGLGNLSLPRPPSVPTRGGCPVGLQPPPTPPPHPGNTPRRGFPGRRPCLRGPRGSDPEKGWGGGGSSLRGAGLPVRGCGKKVPVQRLEASVSHRVGKRPPRRTGARRCLQRGVGGGLCLGGGEGGGSEGCSCRAGPWLGNGVPVGDLGHPSPLGVCGIGSKRAGRVWALQLSRACSP